MPLQRWVDIIIIGFISFILFLALTALLITPKNINDWAIFIHELPTLTYCSILILSGIITQILLHSVGDFTFKKFIKNPPLWVAIFLPIVLLYISDIEHKGVGMNSEFYFSLSPIALGLFFIPFATWLSLQFNSLIQNIKNRINKKEDKNSQALSLIDWLYDESPIGNSLHDKWDRTHIIDRVVSRLNSEKTYNRGECLLGDYGSGKSSVISLIEEKLNSISTQNPNNDWIICRFDSWGRIDNAKQAQGLILEKMIESIGEHTSISALKNLPQRYLDALQGNDAWWNTLFSIFNASSLDPESQLGKIDNILSAIDKKLLLVIEDLDRNTDCNKLSLEIVPLLDRLRELKQVKFIITLGHEESLSSTITRITSFREDLTNHEHEKLDFILKEFRDICLNETAKEDRYIDGVIDRAYWPMVDGQIGNNDGVSYRIAYMQGSIYRQAYLAMKYYLTNPRTLKYCLRATHSAWEKIHGEVNFDDLLCLNIIKKSEPDAFDFIINNIEQLIKHQFKAFENNDIFSISDVMQKNRKTTEEHLEKLMLFLFPKSFSEKNDNVRDIFTAKCLQSIGTDIYNFNMAINQDFVSQPLERDILNEILDTTRNKSLSIFDVGSTTKTAKIIIKFCSILNNRLEFHHISCLYKYTTEKLIQNSKTDKDSISLIGEIINSLLSTQTNKKSKTSTHNTCQELFIYARNYLMRNDIGLFFDLLDIRYTESPLLNVYLNIIPDFINEYPSISNRELRNYDNDIIHLFKRDIYEKMHVDKIFIWIMNSETSEIQIKYLSSFFNFSEGVSFFNKEQITNIKEFIENVTEKEKDSFTSKTNEDFGKIKSRINDALQSSKKDQQNENPE